MPSIQNLIPAAYRKAIYMVVAIVAATELALDRVGWGLMSDATAGKIMIVASALGFTLAAGNTNK